MNYCVLLSQFDEPANVVPCTIDDVLETCYTLIGCKTVQLIPAYPDRIQKGYDVLCDENIHGKTLFINPLASWIYGTDKHGTGIFGNAVILKVVNNEDDEGDLAFMTEEEANALAEDLNLDLNDKTHRITVGVMTARMKD